MTLDPRDRELIDAATEVIRRCHVPERHSVGCAVRTASGRVFTGVNLETCAYGPCAEPIALGAMITAGERDLEAIVAVGKESKGFPIIAPCGNCRQLLIDYWPDAWVIVPQDGGTTKLRARDLLPNAYRFFDEP